MPAAVSAARSVAAAAAYSRMRWRRSIRSRTASVSASRRRRSAGLFSEATGTLQPLQAGFDLFAGEGARITLDDLRHFAGLGGGDRTLRSGGDDGRNRRRDIGGILEWRQREIRSPVPTRPDQASDDEAQYRAVAVHRLGERFPRNLAAGPIEQLLDDHCRSVADTGRLACRIVRLTLQEFALDVPRSLKLQAVFRLTTLRRLIRPKGLGIGRSLVSGQTCFFHGRLVPAIRIVYRRIYAAEVAYSRTKSEHLFGAELQFCRGAGALCPARRL